MIKYMPDFEIEVNSMVETKYNHVIKNVEKSDMDKYIKKLQISENACRESNIVIQYCYNGGNILCPNDHDVNLNIIRKNNIFKFIAFKQYNNINIYEDEIIKIMVLLCIQNMRNKYKEKEITLFSFVEKDNNYILYILNTTSYNILFIGENDDKDENKINLIIKKIIVKSNDVVYEKINNILKNK